MKKTIIIACMSMLALGACALTESPDDIVQSRCLLGDLVYETRDGRIGFRDNDPSCSDTAIN